MSKSKCFEFFDFIEVLIAKIHIDFEFEKIESRLREKIHNIHDDFAKFVKNVQQFDKNQRRLSIIKSSSSNFVIVIIIELSLMIKRVVFNVAK